MAAVAPKPAAPAAPAPAAPPKAPAGKPAAAAATKVGGAAPPAPNPVIQNRPDEPPFQLKVEPDRIIFKHETFATAADYSLTITNTSKSRQCYKVKCTSNEIFRVRPPLGFIEVGQPAKIEFSFCSKDGAPPPARHFFAFYHVACKDDDKAVRSVWTPTAKPDGCKRIMAEFQKPDGSVAGPGTATSTTSAATSGAGAAPASTPPTPSTPPPATPSPKADGAPKEAAKEAPKETGKEAPAPAAPAK